MYVVIVEIVNPNVEVIRTNSMHALHYGNTGFGTNNWICILLQWYATLTIVPKSARTMLIERIGDANIVSVTVC